MKIIYSNPIANENKEINVPNQITYRDFKDGGYVASLSSHYAVAINGIAANDSTILNEGDRISVTPTKIDGGRN